MFDDIIKSEKKTCYSCKYCTMKWMAIYCELKKEYKGFNAKICKHYTPEKNNMAGEPKW